MSESRYNNKVINYLWSKFEAKNGGSTKKAWRFIDCGAKGEVDFKEFKVGLEKLQVNMSNEDIDNTFAFLDSKCKGKINYNDFCKLV
jgi:Ca2+-binding EF-hand superfamily protein